jgi:hypothetical protein
LIVETRAFANNLGATSSAKARWRLSSRMRN